MKIELNNLPKISLNQWYAGKHWTKRKEIKDIYKLIIKSQFKHVFLKSGVYVCEYTFVFKKNALDTSNCVAMLKMIEDIIFEDDTCKIIPKLIIESKKGTKDKVIIKITEL